MLVEWMNEWMEFTNGMLLIEHEIEVTNGSY